MSKRFYNRSHLLTVHNNSDLNCVDVLSSESNVPQLTFKHDNESEYSKNSQEIETKITNY